MEQTNKELAAEAYKRAEQNERECTGCAQTTLAAIMDTLNIANNEVFKSASGLADGVGLSGNGSCGALLGGAIAISYLFGRDRANFKDPLAPGISYLLVKKLHDQYLQKYGTIRCNDVQDSTMGRHYNLWDEKEASAALEGGMLGHCSKVCGIVAEMTILIILEHQDAVRKNQNSGEGGAGSSRPVKCG